MRFCFNVITSLVIAILVTGCAAIRPVAIETHTQAQTTIRDSIRWKDSTIYVQVPIERYVDVVPVYDTLKLETTLASAAAYVDTLTHTLKGSIVNRKDSIRTVIKYQDRKVEIRKDSIVVKEVPVEVEVIRKVVPRWCWSLLVLDALLLLVFVVVIYLKFRQTVS